MFLVLALLAFLLDLLGVHGIGSLPTLTLGFIFLTCLVGFGWYPFGGFGARFHRE